MPPGSPFPQCISFAILLAATVLVSSCGDYAKVTALPSTSHAPANDLPAGTAPRSLASPTPAMTTLPAPSTTPLPRPTALPAVVLAVPEVWEDAALAALSSLKSSGTGWQWRLQDDQSVTPHIVMEIGGDGATAGRRPLALAIPFTSDLQGVSLAEAQDILANGRPDIVVVDFAEVPSGYRALRVDGLLPHDEAYALQQEWVLAAAPGFEPAASELAQILRAELETDPLVHLAAVGDIMLDRALGYAIQQGDIAYPFAGVADVLSAADITIGNLESAMGDAGEPAAKSYTFRAPSPAAQSLALAGFDVLSLANNHAMDFGPEALTQAIALLDRQGIGVVGAGPDDRAARAPHLVEANGITLAFLGYVDVPVEVSGFDTASWEAGPGKAGLAWARPESIAADVAAAGQVADLVVVSLHSGYEYVSEPSAEQRRAAETAVAAGADLVIGHHAHVLQGIGFLDESVIVYGLGNFAFEIDGDPNTGILNVWLDQDGVRYLELVPAVIQFGGQPRLAESWEQAEIRRQVYRLTELLNRQAPYANVGE